MMPRLLTSVALAVLSVLGVLAPVPAIAAAAPTDGPSADTTTWAVRPADAAGADGRPWVEWEAEPGAQRTEYLLVSNYGERDVDFRLTAADGYFTDTGRFTMLPSDRTSVDAGTWIDLPASVRVAAGGSEIVPYSIVVPADATPGDHPAGVAASILSPGAGTIGVESRVGFRVMTRVTGELRAELTAGLDGRYDGSVNPFSAGRVAVRYSLTNTGNTRVRTTPSVTVAGPFGVAPSEVVGEEIVDIAPGETRTGAVTIASAWPLGWYDLRIDAAPVPVSDALAVADAPAATTATTLLALPLSQLATLAVAAGLLTWYLWQRRRTRRKTAALIEDARAAGRAESSPPAPLSPAPLSPAPPSRRAHRASSARVVIALLLTTSASIGISQLGPADTARASSSGVEIAVEISPAPVDPGPSPTAPAASSTPTPAPAGSAPDLPATGGRLDLSVPALGAVLAGAGVLALLIRSARRRRSAAPLRR